MGTRGTAHGGANRRHGLSARQRLTRKNPSQQTGRRSHATVFRVFGSCSFHFHFWKCKPFFPRHRKGADGPRTSHSHAHVLRNNPSTHASHSKCLSVRLSSRTRTCPRCVSVASRGTARFPSLPHAETECLCGLSSLPPGKSNTFRRPPRARPSIDRGTRDSPLSSRPTAASRITGPPAGCRGLRHPGASPRRRVRRLLELTNERTARVFLTGGGRVIASLAIDHARSRHRRRERASRGDQHATAFADFVLVVGRLTLANGRARSSPRRSVFGARTLAKIVPSRRDETPPRLGSVAPLDTPRRRI